MKKCDFLMSSGFWFAGRVVWEWRQFPADMVPQFRIGRLIPWRRAPNLRRSLLTIDHRSAITWIGPPRRLNSASASFRNGSSLGQLKPAGSHWFRRRPALSLESVIWGVMWALRGFR